MSDALFWLDPIQHFQHEEGPVALGLLCFVPRRYVLTNIIRSFEGRLELPVEVEEIAAEIIRQEYQDEIYFFPVSGVSPEDLHGAVVMFRYVPGVYSDARWVTHIPYNQSDTVEWQRVTCTKEMVHVFDTEICKTDTSEELDALAEKLATKFAAIVSPKAEVMAVKDVLALYQCLPLLLPRAALLQAREGVASGKLTIEAVARQAALPMELVKFMLSEDWDTLAPVLDDDITSADVVETN